MLWPLVSSRIVRCAAAAAAVVSCAGVLGGETRTICSRNHCADFRLLLIASATFLTLDSPFAAAFACFALSLRSLVAHSALQPFATPLCNRLESLLLLLQTSLAALAVGDARALKDGSALDGNAAAGRVVAGVASIAFVESAWLRKLCGFCGCCDNCDDGLATDGNDQQSASDRDNTNEQRISRSRAARFRPALRELSLLQLRARLLRLGRAVQAGAILARVFSPAARFGV